jgi:hypothetical protein
MVEAGKRRTPLKKAWQNLVLRTSAYYVLLLGGAALLRRWLPTQVQALTEGLGGAHPQPGQSLGRRALVDAINQPMANSQWSGDMQSAVVAMIVAGLIALPIAWIYILTRQKKGFRQSQVHTLIMLPVVVAGVVVLVKNSLPLAFSLAGIVAAVRFRNTLEDSKDAVYIFVATGIGLSAGVDLPVSVSLSIIFNLVAFLLWYTDLGRSSAALEGTVAERRLEEVRAHVNRPSGFIQRVDDELLTGMSLEQLEVLAERARRRGRRHAPGESQRFDSLLRIRTVDVDVAMQATESLLGEYVKRWKFGSVVHESDGTHVIEYAVQLKKSTVPQELVQALVARGMPAIIDADVG